MVRRLGIVRLDAFQFNRLHRGRLALDFFFQALQQFVLSGHHLVQLLDLMFKVGNVRLKFFQPLGQFIWHEIILAADCREVEPVNYLALRHGLIY